MTMTMTMKKKIVAAVMIVLVVVSSEMESVEADATDCLDACSTGCVQQDTRLLQRCDRKCQIKCDPASSQLQEQHLV